MSFLGGHCYLYNFMATESRVSVRYLFLGRLVLSLSVFLLAYKNVKAQVNDLKIDSLKIAVEKLTEGIEKVNLLSELSDHYYNKSNYSNSMIYASRSLNLARKIQYPKGIGMNLHLLGLVNSGLGNFSEAINFQTEAIKV